MPPIVKTMTAVKRKNARTRRPRAEYLEFKNLDRAFLPALYYGFTPLAHPLSVTREDQKKARELENKEERSHCSCHPEPLLEEKIALLRTYEETLADGPQPVLLASELPSQKKNERRIGLDILGGGKSISEGILIQTARAILSEEGYTETTVAINSVGERECGVRFLRELTGYYRKHLADLPAPCREKFKKNPTDLLECSHDKCRPIADDAPKAISFLSEGSRTHFKEVLEFLEELGIPYRMESSLIGNRLVTAETVFEIWNACEGRNVRLCMGARYNSLARRIGFKRDIPVAGAVLFLPGTRETRAVRRIRLKKPSFFFLQLGSEAKRKSLRVIEVLRKADISVYQALARDKLTAQVGSAEHLKVPYSIIIGQREALDDSVIVRHGATRVQEAVKISELPGYLKKLNVA